MTRVEGVGSLSLVLDPTRLYSPCEVKTSYLEVENMSQTPFFSTPLFSSSIILSSIGVFLILSSVTEVSCLPVYDGADVRGRIYDEADLRGRPAMQERREGSKGTGKFYGKMAFSHKIE